MRHSLAKRMICGVLAFGMMTAPAALVYGDVDSSVDRKMESATLVMKITNAPAENHRHGGFRAVMDKLVEEGKLTRAKADQIIKYAEEKREQRPQEKLNLIDSLKKDGIINQVEADAIKSKFREMKEQIFTDKLNGMVQKGTITKAQAEKIKVYFEAARKEKLEKLKNMTEEQRKAYFKEHKRGQEVLEKLIKDGVVTKEQAEQLKMVLMEGHKH